VRDKLMENKVFKKRGIDTWLSIALNQEILVWTRYTVIKDF
jgi:hypothetical protein